MTYQALPYGVSNILVTPKHKRKPGYPYSGQRDELGRFKPIARSLTLKDRIRRTYPHKIVTGLSAKDYQSFKSLSLKLGVPMSDIMAYLITNHLEQLAHQASFEAGQQSALDNIAANPPENPTL